MTEDAIAPLAPADLTLDELRAALAPLVAANAAFDGWSDKAVEAAAREEGFAVLNLDVRATQEAAITLYEHLGFRRWGTHPRYARVDGRTVAGHFYVKDLIQTEPDDTPP